MHCWKSVIEQPCESHLTGTQGPANPKTEAQTPTPSNQHPAAPGFCLGNPRLRQQFEAREHQGTCLSLRLLSPASLPLFLPPSGHISCSGNKRHSGAGLNSGQLGGPACSPQGLALLSWKKTAPLWTPGSPPQQGPHPLKRRDPGCFSPALRTWKQDYK